MKHTQGKWNVKEVRENLNGLSSFVSYQVVSDDEVVIAKETTEANANLIASAPEMLEALLQINNLELDDWAKKVGKIARTAIAKAEGK
jgi:hypothetical protein